MFGRTRPSRVARQGTADAGRLIAELDRQLEQATRERLAQVAQLLFALPSGWQGALQRDLAYLEHIGSGRRALRLLNVAAPLEADSRQRYAFSTLFLRTCYEDLISDPSGHERLHLVTGVLAPEGVRVPSILLKVPLKDQSAVFVATDPAQTTKQLLSLERSGHYCMTVFHSHIMHGLESTQPSRVDIDTQDRFAAIGWDAIGGIFSLDGYIRFFSTCKDFTVELTGNNAEIVSAGVRETIVKLDVQS